MAESTVRVLLQRPVATPLHCPRSARTGGRGTEIILLPPPPPNPFLKESLLFAFMCLLSCFEHSCRTEGRSRLNQRLVQSSVKAYARWLGKTGSGWGEAKVLRPLQSSGGPPLGRGREDIRSFPLRKEQDMFSEEGWCAGPEGAALQTRAPSQANMPTFCAGVKRNSLGLGTSKDYCGGMSVATRRPEVQPCVLSYRLPGSWDHSGRRNNTDQERTFSSAQTRAESNKVERKEKRH